MGIFRWLFGRLSRRPARPPQPGDVLARFVAPDVHREILVVAADRVAEGILTVRVRTTNLLYVRRGLMPEPEFGPASEVRMDEMWQWTGQPWGGLPDGSSVLGFLAERAKESKAKDGTE